MVYFYSFTLPSTAKSTQDADEVADFFSLEDLLTESCGICKCTTSQLRNAPQLNKDGTCAKCGGK